MTDSNRPDTWPEMYSRAGLSANCPHQMHWDNEDQLYRCINNCGFTEAEPPETKRE